MREESQQQATISLENFESFTYFLVHYIPRKISPRRVNSSHSKLFFSVMLAIIFGLLFLLGLVGNRISGPADVTPQVLSIFLLGIVYIYLLCILVESLLTKTLTDLEKSIISALVNEKDRQSFYQSLKITFSWRRQIWFGAIFSLLMHAIFIAIDPSLIWQFGIGFFIVNIVYHIFHGFCTYFYYTLEWKALSLKNYQFDLFELDPSSTAVVSKVAELLQLTIALTTLMVASATIIFATTKVLPFAGIVAMILLMWISTITLYFVNRNILMEIIRRAKWEKLTKIQNQIRDLENSGAIPQVDTLEHINKLKMYHDSIKNSPDSPWDLKRFINTLNTLVWPTLVAITVNVSDFLEFTQTLSTYLSSLPSVP